MAKKVIRDYVPGKNDFLHFAEVMNKNVEMDLAKMRNAGAVTPHPSFEGRVLQNPPSPKGEGLAREGLAREGLAGEGLAGEGLAGTVHVTPEDRAKEIGSDHKGYLGGKI